MATGAVGPMGGEAVGEEGWDRALHAAPYGQIALSDGPAGRTERTDTTVVDTTDVPTPPVQAPPPSVPTLGGFVLDETFSPPGRIFYSRFYNVWEAPPVTGFYTIRVEERPTPGRGNLVQVFVNDDIIYQTRVQPGPDDTISEQALQGARRAYAHVQSGRGQLKIY